MTLRFRLVNPTVRARAQAAVGEAPHDAEVTIKERTRTLDQNARMWAMLTDIARAEPGGRQHTADVWKALFMHALKHEVAFVMGLNGEPFPLGFRSSRLSVRQMSDLMEFMAEYGARHGVRWSDEARPNPYERGAT